MINEGLMGLLVGIAIVLWGVASLIKIWIDWKKEKKSNTH